MRRPMACIGMLAAILCLWTVVAHAITLHVTDDAFTQKEAPNAPSGAAALSVDNQNLNKEHITYALFDLALLPPTAAIDKAVLRFFVHNVAQAGKLKIALDDPFRCLRAVGRSSSAMSAQGYSWVTSKPMQSAPTFNRNDREGLATALRVRMRSFACDHTGQALELVDRGVFTCPLLHSARGDDEAPTEQHAQQDHGAIKNSRISPHRNRQAR